jgi:ribosomal protein S18 acetylase RimI-like enzyme
MKTRREFLYRHPEPADLDALLVIEQQAFNSDRLSRRRMRHWILANNRAFIVCEASEPGKKAAVAGYILLFYRSNSSAARLYSIAVSENFRGHGIARQLMLHGEQQVQACDRQHIQLEVRPDNEAAIALYASLGYQHFDDYQAFYEDGQDALRFRKTLKSFSESAGIR